ncbi:MAG: ABC transporter ATP-binding protein [Candidatus Alcyoniella australis]|nr:ABC transporter ATP-binding protein [Candidatus Alcyoniella australis]
MSAALLDLRQVNKTFFSRDKVLRAVRDVSLQVPAQSTVGLVGESGCGKSTLGRLSVGLYQPDDGEVLFDGLRLADQSRRGLRALRRRFQMVFQDPQAALSPRMKVGAQVSEAMAVHGMGGTRIERRERTLELFQRVDLAPELYARLPFELSGGQRQRVLIARALATEPDLLVSDEPVASLDLSMQARALRLIADLTAERGMAHLLISHDIRVVRLLASWVHVMYAGRIVERGPLPQTLDQPAHPYTVVLTASVPGLEPRMIFDPPLGEGDVAAAPEIGCPFYPRCDRRLPKCAKGEVPEFAVDGESSGRMARCWRL